MNLSDIPTPLTDAFSAAIFDLPTDLAFAKTVDFARDLERKNAVLREALKVFHDHAVFPIGYLHEGRNAFEAARAALAATEEKLQCKHARTWLEHSASGNESQLVCRDCGEAITPMEHL